MVARVDPPKSKVPHDMLDEAGRESFPASDPPAVTPAVTLDPADHLPVAEAQQEPPPLVEIKEHPVSDPSAQTE